MGPAGWFNADVWFDVIRVGQEPSRLRADMVRCAPGARTTAPSTLTGAVFGGLRSR